MKIPFFALAASLAAGAVHPAAANDLVRADSHAPIGVMADHFHKKGEWMFDYRFMNMEMRGNLNGSNSVDTDTIATTAPNRFFGTPGMPPTLRVVPTDMSMDMHMFGAMYAPSDRVTVMLMGSYWKKSMSHTTYMGGMGTTVLGDFTTESSGWGDTSVTALVNFIHNERITLHAIAGVSLPTGSNTESDEILTPMNMRPTVRLPYPMQLGSGTYDPIVGASYSGFGNRFAWGGQWRSTFRLGDNNEDYHLGNEHRLTGWLSYLFADPVSASVRLEYYQRGNISGRDPLIVAPVQTADPDRQGVKRTDVGVGFNFAGQGNLYGWRLGIEYKVPIQQDLDGPQLETDEQLTIGLQRSFD